ncbi:hypothetical protein FN846DRAFT_911498 [Sphaerosporella brunnea]|uniref:Uncharacterized protein n=1 Tax=Sphaerosporella brunnea TaxID=1250544 RepID=A0A5J5EKE0_9PEZI|nr:hypothetical protein FN846DRAFT_911498 [Sphaerosporella brunnea]
MKAARLLIRFGRHSIKTPARLISLVGILGTGKAARLASASAGFGIVVILTLGVIRSLAVGKAAPQLAVIFNRVVILIGRRCGKMDQTPDPPPVLSTPVMQRPQTGKNARNPATCLLEIHLFPGDGKTNNGTIIYKHMCSSSFDHNW